MSRTEPSSRKEIIKIKCIICCKTQHGGIREKFRMSEYPRPQKFIKATLFLQDDVYTRVADLEDERSIFEADLYYHKVCLESYPQKYFRATATDKPERNHSKKRCLFLEVRAISDLLTKGIGISLSDIRDIINEKYGEEISSNKEVKLFMIEHFQDAIKFCQSEHCNESLLAFSSELQMRDVIQKLRSLSNIKAAAQAIKRVY